jgi:hypothetical protein
MTQRLSPQGGNPSANAETDNGGEPLWDAPKALAIFFAHRGR